MCFLVLLNIQLSNKVYAHAMCLGTQVHPCQYRAKSTCTSAHLCSQALKMTRLLRLKFSFWQCWSLQWKLWDQNEGQGNYITSALNSLHVLYVSVSLQRSKTSDNVSHCIHLISLVTYVQICGTNSTTSSNDSLLKKSLTNTGFTEEKPDFRSFLSSWPTKTKSEENFFATKNMTFHGRSKTQGLQCRSLTLCPCS